MTIDDRLRQATQDLPPGGDTARGGTAADPIATSRLADSSRDRRSRHRGCRWAHARPFRDCSDRD